MSLLSRIEQERDIRRQKPSSGDNLQARRQAVTPVQGTYQSLKARIQDELLSKLDPKMDVVRSDELRRTIKEMYDDILAEEAVVLSRAEREQLFEQIVAEILGLGPLEPFLADPTITEVMVNGSQDIYIERDGKIRKTNAVFESEEHL
ncbi:MAG: CpaF family protein, partial [Anaerolineae bacterium]